MPRLATSGFIVALFILIVGCAAQTAEPVGLQVLTTQSVVEVPNPSFEQGEERVTGWTPVGGPGGISKKYSTDGQRGLIVPGIRDETHYIRSENLDLQPNTLYALSFDGRYIDSSEGAVTTGPVFCNVDMRKITATDWTRYTNFFMTPAGQLDELGWIRFGQWHLRGRAAFDDVEVVRAQPVYSRQQGISLGKGERLEGNRYSFQSDFGTSVSNFNRVLHRHQAFFNTTRWVFGKDNWVIYRFNVGDRLQTEANLEIGLMYYFNGELVVELSDDGQNWISAGTMADSGQIELEVPESLLPARTIWLRLRAEAENPLHDQSDMGAFGVDDVFYEATIEGEPVWLMGDTVMIQIPGMRPEYDVQVSDLGPMKPGLENRVELQVATSLISPPKNLHTTIAFKPEVGDAAVTPLKHEVDWQWDEATNVWRTNVSAPYQVAETGQHALSISVAEAGFQGNGKKYISQIYRADYGELVPGSSGEVALWRADSGWKISRGRTAPIENAGAVQIQAAKNEAEDAQLVVRPNGPLKNLMLTVSELTGPDGATIPTSAVDILKTRYILVTIPSDYTSAIEEWPDPLPPLKAPMDLEADQNQPFYIRVKVPREAKAGIYRGTIELKADGYASQVPLEVEVFDFTLPERMTLTTAFSINRGNIYQYHKLRTPEERAQVFDLYLQNYSEHHISPYNPSLEPFPVRWPEVTAGDPEVDPDSLVVEFDWAAWDREMEKAFDHYHFNSVNIPIHGLGGGDMNSRREGSILGYTEETPQYKAMLSQYCAKVEAHLREKGWLDEAYVYWFDEPNPWDYEFVMNGFNKLKEYAPGLRRMLTEQFEPEMAGGPNLWVPVLQEYDYENAHARQALDEQYWWYVCTVPKAPYLGLFLDHPGLELRTWSWLTWEWDIEGILIWTTNRWHGRNARYPNKPQNPYKDPMAWFTGPEGNLGAWGNGDGRFVYPPEIAADANPPHPVIEGPVDSIRWEMLRDGIEDYEYMAMLERLIDAKRGELGEAEVAQYEALLEVPDEVVANRIEFSIDPAPLEAHREKVARAIEALSAQD